jgi:hypothetical protein
MSEFLGSDAFQWLDANAVDSLRSPDEAFDWVFMMTDGDWTLLDRATRLQFSDPSDNEIDKP